MKRKNKFYLPFQFIVIMSCLIILGVFFYLSDNRGNIDKSIREFRSTSNEDKNIAFPKQGEKFDTGSLQITVNENAEIKNTANRIQVASTAPNSALTGILPSLVSGQIANLVYPTCDQLTLNFVADPTDGAAPLTVGFRLVYTMTGFGANDMPNIKNITWYISSPSGGTPGSTGFQWQYQVEQQYDPRVNPEQQVFVIGGQGSQYFQTGGRYTIGMRIRLEDPNNSGDYRYCPVPLIYKEDYIIVRQESQIPQASFEVKDLITNGMGLVPLNDWVPLFYFNMKYNPDQPAPRTLTQLNYSLYDNTNNLEPEDILEFGLFADSGPEGKPDGVLDYLPTEIDGTPAYDGRFVYVSGTPNAFYIQPGTPMLTWDRYGFPYEMPNNNGNFSRDLNYNLNFTMNPDSSSYDPTDPFAAVNPRNNPPTELFPFVKVKNLDPDSSANDGVDTTEGILRQWVIAGPDPGYGYIVAVRLTYNWKNGNRMALSVNRSRMQPYSGPNLSTIVSNVPFPFWNYGVGSFPTQSTGQPVDSYSPNFYEGDILSDENFYTAHFNIYDITGDTIFGYRPGEDCNLSSWPFFMYTPVAEHTRPRWDISNTLIEAVTGEIMDLRHIWPMDAWIPVIGINAHGDPSAQIWEINLILTDIGGDPFGPPGNGGFNPNYALEPITTSQGGNCSVAVQNDFAFNGAWLWHDSDSEEGNGKFDFPTPLDPSGSTYGISFTDCPMYPAGRDQGGSVEPMIQWEYEPFPPGGGDPWWKVRLRFAGGRRRCPGQTPTGYFHAVPDYYEPGRVDTAIEKTDYYIVLRTNSGRGDLSGRTSGPGGLFGGDFRAFVEPRRWNPRDGGHWDGGLWFSNMNLDKKKKYVQDTEWIDEPYPASATSETNRRVNRPWFTERSHTQDNVKPQRVGFEVHDLVLTYSTDNTFGRETYIHPTQEVPIATHPVDIVNYAFYDWRGANGVSNLSLWVDPPLTLGFGIDVFGIFNQRFLLGLAPPSDLVLDPTVNPLLGTNAVELLYNPGILPDYSEGVFWTGQPVPNLDELTSFQYAFETVPFEPTFGDPVIVRSLTPRSTAYPKPFIQPTLPDYYTWPMRLNLVNFGSRCIVYADEGSLADNLEYYHFDPTEDPNVIETWQGVWAGYKDDIYYAELLDGNFAGVDLSGWWFVDNNGGRYYIKSNSGNVLELENGHAAYVSAYMMNGSKLDVSQYPYGVKGGRANAVERGPWLVVKDAMVRNRYPQMADWPLGWGDNTVTSGPNGESRAARILRQKVEYKSQPVAVLGLNLSGADDPVVNKKGPVALNSLYVAFWGPEFDPSDLTPLDSTGGTLPSSGVLLYEDTNGDGVFTGPVFLDTVSIPVFTDRIVPLVPGSLEWGIAPEPVDLDGDNIPDDLSGDGIVTDGSVDLSVPERPSLTSAQLRAWDKLKDLAWVLKLTPTQPWTVPQSDVRSGGANPPVSKSLEENSNSSLPLPSDIIKGIQETEKLASSTKKSLLLDIVAPEYNDDGTANVIPVEKGAKALTAGGHQGDDLFVVIRTSDTVSAFEEFRCVVPARLPDRTPTTAQFAGVVFSQGGLTSRGAVFKTNPEEGGLQDFYGHDMLQVSVPARVVDMTDALLPPSTSGITTPVITPGGQPIAILGVDASMNRVENLIAYGNGTGASAGDKAFSPDSRDIIIPETSLKGFYSNGAWTQNIIGMWLVAYGQADQEVNKRVEAFEITGAQGRTLRLRAGTPKNGSPWYVVKDPTFLEQLIVEFYNANTQTTVRGFDPYNDLLPLDEEDPANEKVSGVSIWRDNDWDPRNTNGVFDPPIINDNGTIDYIDLPLRLDSAPVWYSRPGDPRYQVRFVFSSPGTDNSIGRDPTQGGTPYTSQPRLRQPIPICFGDCPSENGYGPDFFVVIRTSSAISAGDAFQAAIVSFGSDTPTEPDPDNFIRIYPGAGDINDGLFYLYSEFPWGNRALGFISFFKDPLIYRYWAYNDRLRKWTARAEVDTSQAQSDRLGLNWVRTNPVASGRTKTIIALQVPTVDFTADRQRQVPGGQVKFTLLPGSGITVSSVQWDFGDGTQSTDRNPTHIYSQAGTYTVSVVIKDKNGLSASKIKRDYIEILSAPYVSFSAQPTSGYITPDAMGEKDPGLDVQFRDMSVGTDVWKVVAWSWSFGDNVPAIEATQQNPIHRYTKEGFYSVTLEVTFKNVNTNETMKLCYLIPNYITVGPCIGCPSTTEGEGQTEGATEGEGQEEPSAKFSVQSIIKDKEALLPLTDWVPLFNFTMGYDPENPAPRVLKSLVYRIRADKRSDGELNYGNQGGPNISDLLEFALFRENYTKKEEYNNQLDPYYDELLFKWDSDGTPLAQILTQNPYSPDGVTYRLNFIGSGTPDKPDYPVVTAPNQDDGFEGNSYIVAVRTSATWRSQITMACDVLRAEMIKLNGIFPRNTDGEPIDEYDPNFYDADDPERMISDAGYSASFTVWDLNGIINPEQWEYSGFDAWNYPTRLYTPLAEHTRPKWSKFDQLLYMYAGELLSFRRLVAMDTWKPVIGINVHSTKSVHADGYDPLVGPRYTAEKRIWPQLREVNVIFTDIGADPYGPPGNGGFDPREALDKVSTQINSLLVDSDQVLFQDIIFNGVWVWHDTNNNGKFDPPTPLANGQGVQLNGDYPMLPETVIGINLSEGFILPTGQLLNWEYIPFPPGGGDPWWKLNLRFFYGRRRYVTPSNDDVSGHVEPIPDNYVGVATGSEYACDYFVVVRTDSGFKDVSQTVPDGNGIMMGADFRVFIEPRRVDNNGKPTGGIYVDSQIPPLGGLLDGGGPPWQSDSRWGQQEPWWNQRTVNEKSTKPIKVGLDVHDLVLTYTSDSPYKFESDIFYGSGSINLGNCLGYSVGLSDYPKDFDRWMDPEGKIRTQFLNLHSVGVTRWREFGGFTYSITDNNTFTVSYDYTHSRGQYAYETVPFDHVNILGPDTRSSAYVNPLDQPALPDYTTWSRNIGPNEYPRASQWAPEFNRARLLTQKTDINSEHTAMLGINLVGSGDYVVNNEGQESPSVAKIVVAFWGPDFSPDIFMPLDPDGKSYDSGVLLWEDTDQNGIFFEPKLLATYWDLPMPNIGDKPVPLNNLQWSSKPEPIDIDGDGSPDDMDGNGLVDQRDYAWVLTIYPKEKWTLPTDDFMDFLFGTVPIECGNIDFSDVSFEKSIKEKSDEEANTSNQSLEKQITAVKGNNPGDDLFITVRLNDKGKRFQTFRAIIPATLPGRSDSEKKAGIQFFPQVNTSSTAYIKSSPEEDPVQDFYGNDMLETNIPVQIYDFTSQQQAIVPGGPSFAVMGFDVSTNRPEDSLYQGTNGVGSEKTFTVSGVTFEPNSLIGDFLIDSAFESYEIVGNTINQVYLLSGTPRNGSWRIERNPSFLEEVTLEFYDEGTNANFNPLNDLLPLHIDPQISGVALYRDNDADPRNRNGMFDADIDIPISLDAAPYYIGQTGEATQVKFVFSSPGTDNVPIPREQQARNRQWIPTSFGSNNKNPFYGPDFFVILRASDKMKTGVNFRIGVVNWGPNTPTEPDPDTWARLSGEQRNDFRKFREFPWGVRGLGFITYFKEPPVRYYMDGKKAGMKTDNSGVNWLRSHCTKKRRTGVINSIKKVVAPSSLVIESTSMSELPIQTLEGQEVTLVIYGRNFGNNPVVRLSGYQVRVVQATDTTITIAISTMPGVVPIEPVVLLVRNTTTGDEASRTDLFTLTSKPVGRIPVINSINPNKGTSKEFPVTIQGANFSTIDNIQVYFANTLMPVQSVSTDGTSILVTFPLGGIPTVGPLDVTVKNIDQKTEKTLVGGFEYVNDAQKPKKRFYMFGCGERQDIQRSNFMAYAFDISLVIAVLLFLLFAKKKQTV